MILSFSREVLMYFLKIFPVFHIFVKHQGRTHSKLAKHSFDKHRINYSHKMILTMSTDCH